MKRQPVLHPLLLSALLLPLAACNVEKPLEKARDAVAKQESSINQKVREGLDKAKQSLESDNLSLNQGISIGGSHVGDGKTGPKAEITPRGELLIDGNKVELTPEQQAQLTAYRAQIIGIAQAGIDIGAQGAELGLSAAKGAISSVLNADTEDFARRVEAKADDIKAGARQLCARLPALLAAQQQLAASVPAFQPYATLEAADIEDCEKNIDDGPSTADPEPATTAE